MLPSKAARATGRKDVRIDESKGRDTRSRKARGSIDTNPRGATRTAAALASSVEARLKQAGREAFDLLGGED